MKTTFLEKTYKISENGRKGSSVRVCVVLNRAARADVNGDYLLSVKVTQGNDKRFFINIENIRISEVDYVAMCREQQSRIKYKRYSDVAQKATDTFKRVCTAIESSFNSVFVFEDFKAGWKNMSVANTNNSLITLWRKVSESRSPGTEESYLNAMSRFQVDMGDKITFSDFSRMTVEEWRNRMTKAGLSKTTINIYLRSLRVILNEAAKLGLIGKTKDFFERLSIGGRNSYNNRKEKYLSVDVWRRLWHFYETNGEGNPVYLSWRKDYQKDRMEALGMMLFMYLADGINLIDVLCLRYDSYYFQHDRKLLHFQRQKVTERSGARVVFPVLPQIRTILERQGEKEERGGLVFGYLKGKISFYKRDKETGKELRRLTALYNSVIGDRMKSIAKAIGLEAEPTPTWCRHSFASNLIQLGVPKEYIAASMAHQSGDTTDNYIDMYSYDQMVDYNSRLLADRNTDKEKVKMLLENIGKEEILKILNEINYI